MLLWFRNGKSFHEIFDDFGLICGPHGHGLSQCAGPGACVLVEDDSSLKRRHGSTCFLIMLISTLAASMGYAPFHNWIGILCLAFLRFVGFRFDVSMNLYKFPQEITVTMIQWNKYNNLNAIDIYENYFGIYYWTLFILLYCYRSRKNTK